MNEDRQTGDVARLERAVRLLRTQMIVLLSAFAVAIAVTITTSVLWMAKRQPLWRGDSIVTRRLVIEDKGVVRAVFGINDHGWVQLMLGPDDRRQAGIGMAVIDSNRAQLYVNNGGRHITHLTGGAMTVGNEAGVLAGIGALRDSGYFVLTGGGRPVVMYPWQGRERLDSVLGVSATRR